MNEEENLDNQNLNYFNNDYLFLIILILLEKYHTGELLTISTTKSSKNTQKDRLRYWKN